jgi:hypothetical protein
MFSPLTEQCLDEWLANVDTFRVEFLRYCQLNCKAAGYYFEFDQAAIHAAHAGWKSMCDVWAKSYVMPDSNGLSHLKILAILLFHFSSVEWISELSEYDPEEDRIEFAGSPQQRVEFRKDINAGRGTFFAFQFVMYVINWFETYRIDRHQKFEFRLTPEIEHDLMVYLLSERREPMAIYLILKALYARDPRP